jgi:predicted nucleotidyltransferase
VTGWDARRIEVIEDLAVVCEGTEMVVVGAAALEARMNFQRGTRDVDLAMAAEPEDIERVLRAGGWLRDPRRPHRWSKADAEVDVMPASQALLRAGSFTWPDGHRMNLVGLALALRTSSDVALRSNRSVRVAQLPALLLLKTAAYLDRPSERDHDLEDIVAILRDGIEAPDNITAEVVQADVEIRLACAFIVGAQLACMVDDAERAVVREFVAKARDPSDRHQTLQRLARHGRWREELLDRDPVEPLIDTFSAAFETGLIG